MRVFTVENIFPDNLRKRSVWKLIGKSLMMVCRTCQYLFLLRVQLIGFYVFYQKKMSVSLVSNFFKQNQNSMETIGNYL